MILRLPQRQAIIVQLSSTTQSFKKTAASDKKFFNLYLKIASAWSLFGIVAFVQTPVFAQSVIAPDNTLGAENSNVVTNFNLNGLPVELITGGATRGINLFHSFQEFNVSEGRGAYFLSPSADIQNILARVTGSNRSEILGRLGISGESQPNLFLMNPNGIIFGNNASLDLQGSFVGTTANAIQFGEKGNFSTTNPQAPGLLTVNPSALFFNQINRSEIVNRSRQIGIPGSFYLVGGDITFDNGVAGSLENRLELGAVAGIGTVGLIGSGNQMQLVFPEGISKADIVMKNNAFVVTNKGSAITVNTGNLSLSNNSFISSVFQAGEGQIGVAAADVVVNASGDVILDNLSNIISRGLENSLGNTGNVIINARSIRLINQSQIGSNSQRSQGNIILNAQDDVSLDRNSFISTGGVLNAIGKSGDITITSPNINLNNQSGINSANFGQGEGGKITLKAQEAISLNNESRISSSSAASVFGGVNNLPSGDIEIKTKTLALDGNNTIISSANFDEGKGGNIRVVADDSILLNDLASISSSSTGKGDSGIIQLDTRSLTLTNGGNIGTQSSGLGNSGNLLVNASDFVNLSGITTFTNPLTGKLDFIGSGLTTSAFGAGNGGQLTMNTQRLSINDGGYITTTSSQSGRGGNLTINAKDFMEVVGRSPNLASRVSTSTLDFGDSGSLNINTSRLSIRDGATVTTLTPGTGKGGELTIDAKDSVEVIGGSSNFPNNRSIISTTAFVGDAGNMKINTGSFSIRDGGQVTTSTFGKGRGGNLTVNATTGVEVIGISVNGFVSSLNTSAAPNSTGNAGDMKVNTPQLLVRDGAEVLANARGIGNAGIMTISASRIRLDNKASINANTRSPNKDPNREQATININTQNLTLRRNSSITTDATGENVIGGNINIDTNLLIALENSRISANSDNSRGGRVRINAQGVFVGTQPSDLSKYITATSGVGLSGTVNVNSPDNSAIQNSLTELPTNAIDTNALIANSCIARGNKKQESSFIITGGGALPNRPGDVSMSNYSIDRVRSVNNENTSHPWKKGDPIVEPNGVYRLPNGQLIMSRECQNN
ncbi:filamentous hemagglutinin N-terminal domain-containing protein [Komarekiella sp. 'clone 1']|uniref:Filamentous hemagglutinin N-terminal domain-containing protein n=1 Tax=Komarekiella delphini-convector SJRDD-AB1 TaxID=2593771 RepID=A0AA40SYA0_9NOST|nr:S-layer family protein [Komarekiella delphini-convector]MBD6617227.1 filamentous hemagglutinin N-terminal domain-containing protein [Komarekiella delphini-convector SJRDD-AB1]